MYLMIVKRGDLQQLDLLHKTFAPSSPIQVIWDRRVRERRKGTSATTSLERRQRERRGPTPASWTALSFVVVQSGTIL